MQSIKAILVLLLSGIFPVFIQGQSLVEDTRELISALRAMEQAGNTSGTQLAIPGNLTREDSILERAAGKALAILYYYDNPNLVDSSAQLQPWAILQRYRENLMLREVLQEVKLGPLGESGDTLFLDAFQKKIKSLQKAPRHEMMEKLYNEDALSPSVYLSIPHSLQRYSQPPLSSAVMLKRAAQESTPNAGGDIFSAPAIIRGLFNFILERAQEEVAINFLERLLGGEVDDLKALFPSVAGAFDGRNFTFSTSFIERLRLAFYQDMQLLPVRLPELMLEDESFQAIRNDPAAYNLFVIFTMAGMAQGQVPVEEILPVTNRYLIDSYREAKKHVNLRLARGAYSSPEYLAVVSTTEDIFNYLPPLYLDLDKTEHELHETIRALLYSFPDLPSNPVLESYPNREVYDFFFKPDDDSYDEYDLSMLPQLLRGELDSAYVLGFNTIEEYDKLFGRELTPEQRRAGGLELARNLTGNWYAQTTIDEILSNWQKSLVANKLAVEKWINANDLQSSPRRTTAEMNASRLQLQDTIHSTLLFWQSVLSSDQRLALQLLESIASDFSDIMDLPSFLLSNEEKTEMAKGRLVEIEKRLVALNDKLSREFPEMREGSPAKKHLEKQKALTPYAHFVPMIDELTDKLQLLQFQLDNLEKDQVKKEDKAKDRDKLSDLINARNNARLMLQLTELGAQLAFGLRSDNPDKKWIEPKEMKEMLNGGLEQQVFLGLLQQRLLNVPAVGPFSPQGMAQLMEMTVKDLPLIIDNRSGRDNKGPEAFHNKATFVVNLFSRILELPLLPQRETPGGEAAEKEKRQARRSATDKPSGAYIPLVKQNPKLEPLPELSRQAVDLIYYLSKEDHRHAVSSAIRVFSALDEALSIDGKADKKGKASSIIRFFRTYGDFIADLVEARSGEEVEKLLNSIADPPGSSRLKRQQDFTVALNAYLGGNFGYESWRQNTSNTREEFWEPAPTMPVGISTSWLFGGRQETKQERRPSFTAFLSFLDLGALLTYRSTDKIDAKTVFSIKNVFKPGLQLHWNFRNTPFYFGIGGHYGTQFLEADGEEVGVKTVRGFAAFGIDVPIKTLFQR